MTVSHRDCVSHTRPSRVQHQPYCLWRQPHPKAVHTISDQSLLHCCHCQHQHALTCICCSPPVTPQAAASALLCGVSVPATGGRAQHSGGLVGVLAVNPSCINTTQDGGM